MQLFLDLFPQGQALRETGRHYDANYDTTHGINTDHVLGDDA